jgi:hypothetical protein
MRLLVALILALGLHSAVASAEQEFWTVERRSAVIAVRAFAAVGDAEPSERGTGFFVSREGFFVTAEHLVRGATRVQFSLDGTGGPWIDFSRVGAMSLGWDLALLKAPERVSGFPMLPLGCPETVRREAQLRFAGFPFGRDFDQRRAEVSSNAGLEGGLQLDANAAGGFSGGPVLDASGRVVAVISAGVTRTPGFLQVVPLSRARSQLGNFGVFVPRPEECQQAIAPGSGSSITSTRACRDSSHGVERYARTFEVTRESSWMGGGYDQGKWCNDAISVLRGEHPNAQFSVVGSSENSESRCAPFNCPQYRSRCTVRVQADPIYVERPSQACLR